MTVSSVIVDATDIVSIRAFEAKHDSELIVDPDRVVPTQAALESVQPVAGREARIAC